MPVTQQMYLEFTRPFAAHEHGIKPGGGAYILKTAIEKRLYKVAPGWEMSQPTLITVQGDVVVMSASLKIEGQSHGAIGTGIIKHSKDGNSATDAQFVSTAFKTASSDCLPRAALLFGLGWYLKVIPEAWKERVKNKEGLSMYLDEVMKAWEKANIDTAAAQTILDGTAPKATATGQNIIDATETIARTTTGHERKQNRISGESETVTTPAIAPHTTSARVEKTFTCSKLKIAEDKHGRTYTLFAETGERFMTLDTVQFVGSNIDPKIWKQGEYPLMPSLLVNAVQAGRGWDIRTITKSEEAS